MAFVSTTNQKRRKTMNKSIPRVCGSCNYFTTKGSESYCMIRDPYTFCKSSDKACWEFTLPKEKNNE